MCGERQVRCMSLHNNEGLLSLPLPLLTIESMVDGVSSVWCPEVDDIGWLKVLENSSNTLERPGQSFRRWSPLKSIHGNLGLWSILVDFSTWWFLLAGLTVVDSCPPSCLEEAIGLSPTWWQEVKDLPSAWSARDNCCPPIWWRRTRGLFSHLGLFFLLFFFFFFDFWLLVTIISPNEEEEGEFFFIGVESKGSMLMWCIWHVVLTRETLGAFGTFGMENNQAGSTIVRPERSRVSIMAGPTFPKHGKVKGSTW